jgi:outer membrane immunogenic protein
MRSIIKPLTIVLGLLGTYGVAAAADMPRKALPPAPVPVWSWTGFYLGIHGGYGTGEGSITGGTGSFDLDGGFVGGQLGYNIQNGNFVWGIEVDSAWANIGRSETAVIGGVAFTGETDIDYLGSLRLRAGYAQGQTLWYITGGLGWMHNEITATAAAAPFVVSTSSSNTHLGWNIGAGVEWAFNPNWSVKGEYLYYDFQDETYFSAAGGGFGMDAQIHTFKIGLNYLFR